MLAHEAVHAPRCVERVQRGGVHNTPRGRKPQLPHKVRGRCFTVGSPIKFSDLKPNVTASPLLGEHTDEVLAELGCSAQQIAAMHEVKAV